MSGRGYYAVLGAMAVLAGMGSVGTVEDRRRPRYRTVMDPPAPRLDLTGALAPKPKGKRGKRRAKAKGGSHA